MDGPFPLNATVTRTFAWADDDGNPLTGEAANFTLRLVKDGQVVSPHGLSVQEVGAGTYAIDYPTGSSREFVRIEIDHPVYSNPQFIELWADDPLAVLEAPLAQHVTPGTVGHALALLLGLSKRNVRITNVTYGNQAFPKQATALSIEVYLDSGLQTLLDTISGAAALDVQGRVTEAVFTGS